MKIAIVGRRLKPDKSKLWCTNCQRTRHTKENCFLIVGFPEWREEGQKAKARLAVGIGEGGGLFHDTTGNRETANTRGSGTKSGPPEIGTATERVPMRSALQDEEGEEIFCINSKV